MITIYIAHTFELRHYVLREIVPKLQLPFIRVINPFYNNDGTTSRVEVQLADELEKRGFNPKESKEWVTRLKCRKKEIVINDLKLIDKSDILIAVMEENSAGTICEIAYQGIFKNKPVYILTTNQRIISHPWLSYASRKGKIIKNINELIKILKRRYK